MLQTTSASGSCPARRFRIVPEPVMVSYILQTCKLHVTLAVRRHDAQLTPYAENHYQCSCLTMSFILTPQTQASHLQSLINSLRSSNCDTTRRLTVPVCSQRYYVT